MAVRLGAVALETRGGRGAPSGCNDQWLLRVVVEDIPVVSAAARSNSGEPKRPSAASKMMNGHRDMEEFTDRPKAYTKAYRLVSWASSYGKSWKGKGKAEAERCSLLMKVWLHWARQIDGCQGWRGRDVIKCLFGTVGHAITSLRP